MAATQLRQQTPAHRGALHAVARACVSCVFLFGAYAKATGFRTVVALLAGRGVPWPAAVVGTAIAIELIGALLLISGIQLRWASLGLLCLLVLATLFLQMHAILGPDRDAAWEGASEALKHLAIVGGLLRFFSDGGGAARARRTSSFSEEAER